MKAYLVLDLTVNDIGRFQKHIAEISAFIAKQSGRSGQAPINHCS
jgi:hypothetical protein